MADADTIAGQLAIVAALHRNGDLSDDEFAAAKAEILAPHPPPGESPETEEERAVRRFKAVEQYTVGSILKGLLIVPAGIVVIFLFFAMIGRCVGDG